MQYVKFEAHVLEVHNSSLFASFSIISGLVGPLYKSECAINVVIVAVGRWDGRRNRPVPDAVWLEQHRRALPFVLKRENERGGAVAPRLVSLLLLSLSFLLLQKPEIFIEHGISLF